MPSRNKAGPVVAFIVVLVILVVMAPLLAKYRAEPAVWVAKLQEMSQPQKQSPTMDLNHIVWVNRRSGLYYCRNSRFYGRMHPGLSMQQGSALQKGFRPAEGHACP
jgi:hypothetical protein